MQEQVQGIKKNQEVGRGPRGQTGESGLKSRRSTMNPLSQWNMYVISADGVKLHYTKGDMIQWKVRQE